MPKLIPVHSDPNIDREFHNVYAELADVPRQVAQQLVPEPEPPRIVVPTQVKEFFLGKQAISFISGVLQQLIWSFPIPSTIRVSHISIHTVVGIPQSGDIVMAIYNVLGTRVTASPATLIEGSGQHLIPVTPVLLAPGQYYVGGTWVNTSITIAGSRVGYDGSGSLASIPIGGPMPSNIVIADISPNEFTPILGVIDR